VVEDGPTIKKWRGLLIAKLGFIVQWSQMVSRRWSQLQAQRKEIALI
jgi:hypothetical protein